MLQEFHYVTVRKNTEPVVEVCPVTEK
jgi:hypothetical protein